MSVLTSVLFVVQIVSALGMIGLILMQQGKGADMGAAFGSGGSGSLFGATGSANVLSRTTAVLASVFFVCTLALAFVGSRPSTPSGGALEKALNAPVAVGAEGAASAAVPTVPASGAAQIPKQ